MEGTKETTTEARNLNLRTAFFGLELTGQELNRARAIAREFDRDVEREAQRLARDSAARRRAAEIQRELEAQRAAARARELTYLDHLPDPEPPKEPSQRELWREEIMEDSEIIQDTYDWLRSVRAGQGPKKRATIDRCMRVWDAFRQGVTFNVNISRVTGISQHTVGRCWKILRGEEEFRVK